jgi:hypothetical protein
MRTPNRMHGRTWQPTNGKPGFMKDTGHAQSKEWMKLINAMKNSTVKAPPVTPDGKWLHQDEARKASGATYGLGVEVQPSESSKGQLHATQTRSN